MRKNQCVCSPLLPDHQEESKVAIHQGLLASGQVGRAEPVYPQSRTAGLALGIRPPPFFFNPVTPWLHFFSLGLVAGFYC